jgi:hypothetical protein
MIEEVLKLLAPLFEIIPTGKRVADVFENISNGIEAMNYRFVQSRQRVTEFSQAIGDAVPMVERLGGNAADVSKTIDSVAAATRRNVVASSEEITKLYAAQKLTGVESQILVDKFQNVGVAFSQIGTQLEGSIKYIQSVGGNARDIMGQVSGILDNINKYNFQDGVLGLTRMATQAQLLKFDMSAVLGFAEKALTPEGAIELSSAFQRLGVAAGDLTDPFQLMYKALNDPEGLQNSIVEMTKKFTFFDEKSKSFKINPEGMLMLREIGAAAGISSAELSKMALNAADLDDKISKISPSFDFESEEDRQYIANIAKMGAGGEYEITVKDEETGENKQILLQEASNKQLQELIDAQKQQKELSLEELQKAQLDLLTLIKGELLATRDNYLTGAATSKALVELLQGNKVREDAIQGIRKFTKDKNLDATPAEVRKIVDKGLDEILRAGQSLINNEGKILLGTIKPIFEKVADVIEAALGPLTRKIEEILKTNGINLPDLTPPAPRASGGYVYGPGTETSDSIPTLLSNGEFVVNAESTSAFGSLLEKINANPDYNLTEFTNERLQLKNTNEIASSTITNKTITEQISNLQNLNTNNITRNTKVEFGEISPLKVIFEKGPGFTDNDMAMLEFNLSKESITQQLTESISKKLQILQEKDT